MTISGDQWSPIYELYKDEDTKELSYGGKLASEDQIEESMYVTMLLIARA